MDSDVQKFIKFMSTHLIKKTDTTTKITHTLMGPLHSEFVPFRGKYHISEDDDEEFIESYQSVFGKMKLHIVERPKEIGPMVTDYDFKTTMKYRERQYLDEHIEYVTKLYIDLYKKYLDVDHDKIKVFIFEKPKPTFEENNQLFKDGFHKELPFVPLNVKKRFFFFNKVRETIIKEDGFSNIPFVNSYDEILDSSVIISNGMLMYGSCKENREPYFLTKVYNHDMTIENTENYDDVDLVELLSIRQYSDQDKDTPFKKDLQIDEEFEKYSVKKFKVKDESTEESDSDSDSDSEKEDNIVGYEKTGHKQYPKSNYEKSDIEFAIKLTGILSKKRATKYEDWIRVGWTLFNISPELLPEFIKFSKKSPEKYEDGCCEKVWNTAKNAGWSIASLIWWAKQDNINEYQKIIHDKVKNALTTAESGTQDDIAELANQLYGHMYKCVNISKKKWYEFRGNKWILVDEAYSLAEKIATEMVKEFMMLEQYYLAEAQKNVGGNADYWKQKQVTVGKLYIKLKTNSFLQGIVSMCARKMHDPKFEESLDSNPLLLGVENGVFDLKMKKFRSGTPDDLISMTTKIDYKEYTFDSPEVKEIEKYFCQVLMDKEVRGYTLRLIASFLDGYVKDQKLIIWTGSGCHNKGTKIRMFDGTVKNIEDIDIGDHVLGSDSRKRRVETIFRGTDTMYDIISENTFRVTANHRLALRCHFKPEIIKTYDNVFEKNIFWVSYHEMSSNLPTTFTKQFYHEGDANNFIKSLIHNPNVIQYCDVIPVYAESVNDMEQDVSIYYKLFKKDDNMENDCQFKAVKLEMGEYFGIELDGNKQYVMENNFVTYNSNGKSTTIDLINNALGDYACPLINTVLTRKRGGSSNAIPELADKRGKRFLVVQEPEKSDEIYVGQMKELTAGNDKIYARALYGDPFYYKPQFKIILTCNKLPNVKALDGGTWRRLRVVPFESKFVEKPEKPNHFKRDPSIEDKINKTWARPFLWLLLNKYYKEYIEVGLQEPDKVTEKSNEYQKKSDCYYEFLKEMTIKTDKDTDRENIGLLYSAFKPWYSQGYNSKPPNKNEFDEYIKENYEVKGDFVRGLKFKSEEKDKDTDAED